jgi:hypothetical protein
MTARDPDLPHGSSYWAARWKTSRWKAREVLRLLRRRYGASVVWLVPTGRGNEKALVATEASLRAVAADVAKGRNGVLLASSADPGPYRARHDPDEGDEDDEPVTREQFQKAIAEIWAELRAARRR